MFIFDECNNLKELNLSSFNTQNFTNIKKIFFGCDIKNFDLWPIIFALYIQVKALHERNKIYTYLHNFLIIISLMNISRIKAGINGVNKITCVEDSITDGIDASNGENIYPPQLKKISFSNNHKCSLFYFKKSELFF